jgi:nicotinate-nucleotide adenylyltransferase
MLIPARIPPHKPVEDEPGAEHRLELCRLAVQGDERMTVSDVEVTREGPSYTVDTLEELNSRAPDTELFLIVGGDVAAGLPRWREPGRVLSLASLAVAERDGTDRATIDRALSQVPGGDSAAFFPMPTISISSSAVRERARAGEPIRYLVPDAVAAYIRDHGLYEPDGGISTQ